MKELLQANIFSVFPTWKAVFFTKEVNPKLLRFEVTEEERVRPLYLASVISRDEKMTWQSFQDVLDHTAKIAQSGMQGFYGVEVLAADLREGIRHFDPAGLAKLFVNHGRDLGADQRALIRYGQIFCILQKRAPADWGKIDLRTHVEIVDPEKARLGNCFRKMVRESGQAPGAVYLIHDLSAKPVFDLSERLPQDEARDFYVFHAESGLVRCPEESCAKDASFKETKR